MKITQKSFSPSDKRPLLVTDLKRGDLIQWLHLNVVHTALVTHLGQDSAVFAYILSPSENKGRVEGVMKKGEERKKYLTLFQQPELIMGPGETEVGEEKTR